MEVASIFKSWRCFLTKIYATGGCKDTMLGYLSSTYESLGKSPPPFICVQLRLAAEIDEMRTTIAALTAEVDAL